MKLLEPVDLGGRRAPNRVVFGPHETNLGDGRCLSGRHVAYYVRRAAGGAGVIVTEEASVHDSDWPYERAPLASRCGEGWAAVATACRAAGPGLVLAALGHSGGQGSSAYGQRELWAPSRVPEVASREVPKWMEADDIAAVVAGFGAAAKLAADAGLDGVEVNAGQHSLVRQFLSGLTNHRGDEWGTDRLRLAREVLGAVRDGLGPGRVLGVRLSCDELAPWAGITPEVAEGIAADLAGSCDYLVVVRGSIFTVSATRPDLQEQPGFNIGLCRAVRAAVAGRVPVVLQGSVVDPGQAEWAVADGVADLVEMTRVQLADADLVAKLAGGRAAEVRPCTLCNQACRVRDARNPVVSCVADPRTGYEAAEPDPGVGRALEPRDVLVVGGGPAGLEAARVAALRGHRVRLVERSAALGGMARTAARGAGRARLATLVDWLEAECRRLGVAVATGVDGPVRPGPTEAVLVCTGGRPGERPYRATAAARVFDVTEALEGPASLPDGPVAIWDPIGGPIAVSLAELLGERAVLVTPDNVAGNELSRSGDLAPANVRLERAGVRIERRSVLRAVKAREVEVEERFSGVRRTLQAACVVDAGFRLPDPDGWAAYADAPGGAHRAGDCVAPRTMLEAVLEGRRIALALG